MAKLKVHKEQGYTNIQNSTLQDSTLSFKARGLLGYMLSLPNDGDFSIKGIQALNPTDGYDSIRTGLKELEDNKYLYRERIRTSGVISDGDYHFFHNSKLYDEFMQELGNQILDNPKQLKPSNKSKDLLDSKRNNRLKNNALDKANLQNNYPLPFVIEDIHKYIEDNKLNQTFEKAGQCHRFLEYIQHNEIIDWKKLLHTFIEKNQDRIIVLEPNTLEKVKFSREGAKSNPNKDRKKQKARLEFLDGHEEGIIKSKERQKQELLKKQEEKKALLLKKQERQRIAEEWRKKYIDFGGENNGK